MWWRLLHYRPGVFGVESEADGAPFFNAADGKTNPAAELEATLRALFGPAPKDPQLQHPYCRFPARLAWLNAKLHFDFTRLPKRPCPHLDDFRSRMRAESITLIFSSYYLNTPASAFGHSFLRLNKSLRPGETERQELLDYGVDYSATVDTDNSLVYALKGLTGLFAGEFSKRPYYYKVREYNDYEARDLWEFDLKLSQAEVDMAVSHMWELGSTYFSYYYLSENCSYHMLGILEVARPQLNLIDQIGWPVLPVDTLKALFKSPDLVGEITYRPSVRSQFRYRASGLSAEELDLVARLAEDPSTPVPPELDPEAQVRVLDVALDLVDFRHARELLDLESEGSRIKQRLLSRRARTGRVSTPSEVPPLDGHPASGHDSRRFSLGPGWSPGRGPYHDLGFRLALHDLTDPRRGYPSELELTFFDTELRYHYDEATVSVEDFSLVSIHSLAPFDRFASSLAWNFRVGGHRIRDAGCEDCLAGLAEVGGGAAMGLGDSLVAFVTVNNRLLGLSPIDGGLFDLPLRFGIGPHAGLRLAPRDDWTFTLLGNAEYLPLQAPVLTWNAQAFVRHQYRKNFSLVAEAKAQPEGHSAQLLSAIYF